MYRKIRVLLSLTVIVTGTILLGDQWRLYQGVPKSYVWDEVENFLKIQASPNDLIVFEPGWVSGYAQDVGRLRSYSAVTSREIFKGEFPPSPKLWVISILKSPRLASHLSKNGFIPEISDTLYSVHLTSYRIPSKEAVYDFSEHLQEAQVSIDYGDDNVQKAELENGAWIFRDDLTEWNQVSVRAESFRNQTRRCIWFHPIEAGLKRISFPNIPMSKRLRIFGGIVDSGLRTPPGTPVFLSVEVGDNKVGTIEFNDTDVSFNHAIDLDNPASANQQVSFEVQTKEQGMRHFCFSAWSES